MRKRKKVLQWSAEGEINFEIEHNQVVDDIREIC